VPFQSALEWATLGAVPEMLQTSHDVALELVGTPTLPDTLAACGLHGVVCFTGMLSNEWTVRDFYPIGRWKAAPPPGRSWSSLHTPVRRARIPDQVIAT
jgi:hypothetical protein